MNKLFRAVLEAHGELPNWAKAKYVANTNFTPITINIASVKAARVRSKTDT
ncbi:MAG TPA: hypothetical protein VFG30_29340 [Polyangiales bacterium]|jgi:hypothetical protein|nr:hypothetical protein [Polyangiales bacterium]